MLYNYIIKHLVYWLTSPQQIEIAVQFCSYRISLVCLNAESNSSSISAAQFLVMSLTTGTQAWREHMAFSIFNK